MAWDRDKNPWPVESSIDDFDEQERAETEAIEDMIDGDLTRSEAEGEIASLDASSERPAADPEAWSGNRRVHFAERLPGHFVAKLGGRYKLVGFRPFGIHPSDAYLFLVMGIRSDGSSYATWSYNGTDRGFFSGRYDLTLAQALELFEGKGVGS